MISDTGSPCVLAAVVSLSPSFGVTLSPPFPLSLSLSQQGALPTIYSASELLCLFASQRERERERGANRALLLSQPARGMMWRERGKMRRREGERVRRMENGAAVCCNFADMSV